MRLLLANKATEDAANAAKDRIAAEFKGVNLDVRQVDRRWEVSLLNAKIGADTEQSFTQPDIERMRRIAGEKDLKEATVAKKEVTVGSTNVGRQTAPVATPAGRATT